ncbi:MAG: hypothetical protein K2P58_09610 [Hyphomonadaceae bacterium]|nr:hypothetical protein [Hyphomonadaceae bacterium]
MTVIPFPRPAPEPLAFAIGARVDLRVGALTGGVVRPRGDGIEVFGFANLARLLRAARMAWRERGAHAPLSLEVPAALHATLEAEMLSEAAIEAGLTRRGLSFELDECALVLAGQGMAERLRAAGWGVALRGDAACPLPLGGRARGVFTELVVDAPVPLDPFLAVEDADRSPFGQRLLAARAAGLTLTAETVATAAIARSLAIAGFDRGGGPFAETSLR